MSSTQFFLFSGNAVENKRAISLGGSSSTHTKSSLLNNVELQRRERELQRQTMQSAELTNRHIKHKATTACFQSQLTSELVANTSTIFSTSKNFKALVGWFRKFFFAQQIFPANLLEAAVERMLRINATSISQHKSDEDSTLMQSFVFLLLNYLSLHHSQGSMLHEELLVSFAEKFAPFFAQFTKLFETALCKYPFSLSSLERLLQDKRFSFGSPVYETLCRKIQENFNATHTDRIVERLLNDQLFITTLLSMDPAFVSHIATHQRLETLSTATKAVLMRKAIGKTFDFDCRFLFECADSGSKNEAYFAALISYVYSAVFDERVYGDDLETFVFVDELHCSEDRFTLQSLGRLGLPEADLNALVYFVLRFRRLFAGVFCSGDFLLDMLQAGSEEFGRNGSHPKDLLVFSVVFLNMALFSASHSRILLSADFDAALKAFVPQLKQRAHHGEAMRHVGSCLLAITCWLDRENSRREFNAKPPLYPPSTTLLSPAFAPDRDMTHCPPLHKYDKRWRRFVEHCRSFSGRSHFVLQAPLVSVRRGHEFEDSLAQMAHINASFGSVHFANEVGVGRGVFRDYLTNALAQALDIETGLFAVKHNQYLVPSALEGVTQQLELAGRLIGVALINDVCLNSKFKFAFSFISAWKFVGGPIFDDVADVDAELFRSLDYVLTHDPQDLYLTFTVVDGDFDANAEVELIPNGGQIAVTDANKHDYVDRVAQRHLHAQNIASFATGLYAVVPLVQFSLFNEAELAVLLHGTHSEIQMEDWKKHTVFTGAGADMQQVSRFWRVLCAFSPAEKNDFLQFVTGCPRPPVLGFAALDPKFTVNFVEHRSPESLPSSHTCFNMVDLPLYPSDEVCSQKILFALKHMAVSGFTQA